MNRDRRDIEIPNVEQRVTMISNCELRVVEKDGKPMITGYAAVFNSLSEDLGGFREMLDQRAFDKALQTCDCRALVNHDANLLMGRNRSGTLRLMTDKRGLNFEADPPDSPITDHYLACIQRGDMSGCSFSFTTDVDQWDHSGATSLRTIMSVRDLFDVGPVTYPAYLDTSVAVRSLELSRRSLKSTSLRPRLLSSRLSLLTSRLTSTSK